MASNRIQEMDIGLSLDPVLNKIFDDTALIEEKLRNLVELAIYKLWLQQILPFNKTRDLDSSLAALHLAMGNLTLEESEDTMEQLNIQLSQWQVEAARVNNKINAICHSKGNVAKHARDWMANKMGEHGKRVPRTQRNLSHLARLLYSMHSTIVYGTAVTATAAFDKEQQFQVGLVTWLQHCGGQPKVVETHNINLVTTWAAFQDILTQRTENVQVQEFGLHDGLSLLQGLWLYKLHDETSDLGTDEDYKSMVAAAKKTPQGKRITIIHEVMNQVPIAIQASFKPLPGHDDVEPLLFNRAGNPFPELPQSFQLSLQEQPIILDDFQTLLDRTNSLDVSEEISRMSFDPQPLEKEASGQVQRKERNRRSEKSKAASNKAQRERQKALKQATVARDDSP